MTPKDTGKDPTYVWIGRRLRWARELVYKSQVEFARVLGVDGSTIHKIESGDRTLSILNLITAANVLRTGADYLLTGDLISVERELRTRLIALHPELLDPPPIQPRPDWRVQRTPQDDPEDQDDPLDPSPAGKDTASLARASGRRRIGT